MSKIERCAFVRRSDARCLMGRNSDLQKRFDVKLPGLQQSICSAICDSDLICVHVVGCEENVKAAIDYLNLFFGKFTKTISYSSKLQEFVDNRLLSNLLEMKHEVVINLDTYGAIKIIGEEMNHVNAAVSSVQEFFHRVKHSKGNQECEENDVYLESLMCSNIPQHVKDSLKRYVLLPSPAWQLLISWVHQIYDKHVASRNESHEDSVLVLDNSSVETEDLSTSTENSNDGVEEQDQDDVDDSVLIIEPPVVDITLITLSDDDDDDTGPAILMRTAEKAREPTAGKTREPTAGKTREPTAGKTREPTAGITRKPTAEKTGEPTVQSLEESKRRKPSPCSSMACEIWNQPGTSARSTGVKRKRDDSPEVVLPSPEVVAVVQERKPRPIVIDGNNLAREHGKVQNVFSSKGILLAINYFLERGHKEIVAFVPQYRRKTSRNDTIDQEVLEQLAQKQLVVFTPSRNVDGKFVSSYDDRFIVKLACENGGVILSNDQFRDLARENATWKTVIQQRLLMYCFVGDRFMIPDDPLGKNGPSIEEFLSCPLTDNTD